MILYFLFLFTIDVIVGDEIELLFVEQTAQDIVLQLLHHLADEDNEVFLRTQVELTTLLIALQETFFELEVGCVPRNRLVVEHLDAD